MEDNNFLAHYGVKGMRWGVRRYRNSDGSLNKRGQKKLSKISKKYSRATAKQDKRIDKYERGVVYGNSKILRKRKTKLAKANKKVLKLEKKIQKYGFVSDMPQELRLAGKMELERLMKY